MKLKKIEFFTEENWGEYYSDIYAGVLKKKYLFPRSLFTKKYPPFNPPGWVDVSVKLNGKADYMLVESLDYHKKYYFTHNEKITEIDKNLYILKDKKYVSWRDIVDVCMYYVKEKNIVAKQIYLDKIKIGYSHKDFVETQTWILVPEKDKHGKDFLYRWIP